MEIRPYAESLRQELLTAAEAGGDEARELAGRLLAPLDAAVRLTLLSALSSAADEITRDLAPGSVEVRLRGVDPTFVVTMAPPDAIVAEPAPPVAEDGPAARINFRPPESLKNRIDEAAAKEGLSVNAWLVRVVSGALRQPSAPPRSENRPGPSTGTGFHIGWVR